MKHLYLHLITINMEFMLNLIIYTKVILYYIESMLNIILRLM